MSELLERSVELTALEGALAAVTESRAGALVLVAGEAGIGKTSLLRAFCESRGDVALHWGGCEPLFTPRPLGPFLEIAEAAGGRLAAEVRDVTGPAQLLSALVEELRGPTPALLVVEDLHWADEATLDAVRMLARRLESLPTLMVLSYREESLDRGHPLRVVLGELPAQPQTRIALEPLSVEAVATLAGGTDVDAAGLTERTGGNPFFVTEVLAAEGAELPATVRDAVLARAARLSPEARALLDAVSIVPSRTELWLLEALVDGYPDGLDACLESEMLRSAGPTVEFRHEVARLAVEDALLPHQRVRLHATALHALATATGERADPARLAHHAEGAGDWDAVVVHAPAAGQRAAALGAHREAARQFARALREADRLPPELRAELYERRSYECYLTDQIAEAVEARRRALEEHRRSGDRVREGDAHRWLSRLAWFLGDKETAEREARASLEVLEPLSPGRELAMAYSNLSQLRMLAEENDEAVAWGTRAIAIAELLDDREILAHALNNVGGAEYQLGSDAGREKLQRSLAVALENGLEEHAARAYTNLGGAAIRHRDYRGVVDLEAGISFTRERDLDSWLLYMSGWLARAHLDQGRWDEAADVAAFVLRNPRTAAPSRITPLVVLGSLRARRGDPGVWEPLDEALRLAEGTGELQRLAPVAIARAEAHWLAGEPGLVRGETEEALELAQRRAAGWATGELLVWRRRAGIEDRADTDRLADAWAFELAGDAVGAAARWTATGCPYEAALALASSDDDDLLNQSVRDLQRLGASRAAAHVIRTLRQRGVRGLRVGPRASTRDNPAGLTRRELQVLELVCEGLRNREIAARLVLAEKTVDHHVSAILRKLAVTTRGQAAAEAARLGIAQR